MREAVVSRVAGVDKITFALVRHSRTWTRGRPRQPNGPSVFDLVAAVDHHRAVRCRAAEEVAPFRFRRVAVGARIDQHGLAKRRALNAQQVGMAVARS